MSAAVDSETTSAPVQGTEVPAKRLIASPAGGLVKGQERQEKIEEPKVDQPEQKIWKSARVEKKRSLENAAQTQLLKRQRIDVPHPLPKFVKPTDDKAVANYLEMQHEAISNLTESVAKLQQMLDDTTKNNNRINAIHGALLAERESEIECLQQGCDFMCNMQSNIYHAVMMMRDAIGGLQMSDNNHRMCIAGIQQILNEFNQVIGDDVAKKCMHSHEEQSPKDPKMPVEDPAGESDKSAKPEESEESASPAEKK